MCKMRLTKPSRKPEPCPCQSMSKATYSQLPSWGFHLRILTCFSSKYLLSKAHNCYRNDTRRILCCWLLRFDARLASFSRMLLLMNSAFDGHRLR